MDFFQSPPLYQIHLYNEGASSALNLDEVVAYLKERLGRVNIHQRGSLAAEYLSRFSGEEKESERSSLAGKLAGSKIRRLQERKPFSEPLRGEVEYEKRYLGNSSSKPSGIFYDGFQLQDVFCELLPREQLTFKDLHIIFTNQLFGTWDENDRRYHARVSVYGFPCIISTTGVVEAPAKPREFYLLKQRYDMLGKGETSLIELKRRFTGRFIDYDDKRLTEVVKGYCLQALFFHLRGDPFCDDKKCRLYNAHWQEELIIAQLGGGYELCPFHQGILSPYTKKA